MSLTRILVPIVGGVGGDPSYTIDASPRLSLFDGLRRWTPSDQFNLRDVDAGIGSFAGQSLAYQNYLFIAEHDNSTKTGEQRRLDFDDFIAAGVDTVDFTSINANAIGYYGLFGDGEWGYYIPDEHATSRHGLAVRIPLDDFQVGSAALIDLSTANANLIGCRAGWYDVKTNYAYYASNHNDTNFTGIIGRVPVDNFTAGAVEILDLTSVDTRLTGIRASVVVGRYAYLACYRTGTATDTGIIARLDLDDFTAGGVTFVDLMATNAAYKDLEYLLTDGVNVYATGAAGAYLFRVPTNNFTAGAAQVIAPAAYDALASNLKSGLVVGSNAYVIGSYDNANTNAIFTIDLEDFEIVSHIETTEEDANIVGALRLGYLAPYVVWVPHNDGAFGGYVARLDALGQSETYS